MAEQKYIAERADFKGVSIYGRLHLDSDGMQWIIHCGKAYAIKPGTLKQTTEGGKTN